MVTSVPNADGSTPPSASSPAVPPHPTNIGSNASNVPIAVAMPTKDGGRSGDGDAGGGIGAGADANRLTVPDYETASFGPRLFLPLPALESMLMKKKKKHAAKTLTKPPVNIPREQQQHKDEPHRPSDVMQAHA